MSEPFDKYVKDRPYADSAQAAEKLIEIAQGLRVDKGRMPVGEWNDKFRAAGGSIAQYAAGRDRLIADKVIEMHECGAMFMWRNDRPEAAV